MPSRAIHSPDPTRQAASRWHDLLFAPAHFSEQGETARVRAFLGDRPGTFVEVGAFEPVALSQTYHLERAGWNGVLVEPQAEYAAQLRSTRRARVFEVACGAPEDEGRELPLLVADGLSTLRDRIKDLNANPAQPRLVKVRTLDAILAEAGVETLDFLSIDVEGYELPVLRGFSIDRYRPRLMLIEDDVHSRATHNYVCAAGYKLVRRTLLNNWYVPHDTVFPVSLFGRWQLLRKLYLAIGLRRMKYAWRSRRLAQKRRSGSEGAA